nr:MAG TPA: hypothetical protein [Caudoviricetes sp.]
MWVHRGPSAPSSAPRRAHGVRNGLLTGFSASRNGLKGSIKRHQTAQLGINQGYRAQT